jgi:tetratricopeptide (TPR) repeat protein
MRRSTFRRQTLRAWTGCVLRRVAPVSGPRKAAPLAFAGLLVVVTAGNAAARDRVVLQPPDKVAPLALSGDIADYTAERIEIHLTVGNPVHTYPAAHVVTVETVQTEAHREGVSAFSDGDIDAAERRLEQALQDEPRRWVRREILGWLIKVAQRRGDRATAGRRFLQIVADDPAAREYALAPLVWTAAPIGSNLQQHGRLWLTGAAPAEQLMGASVLLLDQRYGETARARLDQLAREVDPRIAALARAQLWRLRVTAPDITDNELASWETTIAGLPSELRAGPYYLLGRAAMQRSEYDRAAAALMWLPTAYRENEFLTAHAAMAAANSLERIGRLSEARLLLEELTREYEWSSVAGEAKALLSELGEESSI